MDNKLIIIIAIVGLVAICGIVVFIAGLTSVFLTSSSGSNIEQTQRSQSQNAWIGAVPFSIEAASASETTLVISMRNNDLVPITLTSFGSQEGILSRQPVLFESGEEKLIVLTLPSPCGSPGISKTVKGITIEYTKGNAEGLVQTGFPLIVTCG